MLKRNPPVDWVRCGAVSLPIRRSPVTMLIRDPDASQIEGHPPKMIKKVYDSFYVDARAAGRGRLRGATIDEAKKKGEPVAKELAKEGQAAIQLSPEERRIYVIARNALKPFDLAVDEGARRLGEILKALDGESFEKVMQVFRASGTKLKVDAKIPEIFELYVYDQEVIRGNSEYHVRDIEKFVGKFASKFTDQIIPLTTDQIDDWLENLGGGVRNKNNARDHIIGFFNFAQEKDFLLKGVPHAASSTSPFKERRQKITTEEEALESITDIEFYTPGEMRLILDASPRHLVREHESSRCGNHEGDATMRKLRPERHAMSNQ